MPDSEGNITDQDWANALGGAEAGYVVEEGPVDHASETPPVPQAPPAAVPQAPPTPQAPPVAAQQPNYAAQQEAFQSQQFALTVQQRMAEGERQLVESQQATPATARLTAEQWGAAQMAQYQIAQANERQFTAEKQAAITRLSTQEGIDPSMLGPYNDIVSMTAAAKQAGAVEQLRAQVGPSRAPVQQFDGGVATPASTEQRQALNYVSGDPRASLTTEQFIQTFGFDPR